MEFGWTDQNPHGIWMDWDPLVFEGPVARTEKNRATKHNRTVGCSLVLKIKRLLKDQLK